MGIQFGRSNSYKSGSSYNIDNSHKDSFKRLTRSNIEFLQSLGFKVNTEKIIIVTK